MNENEKKQREDKERSSEEKESVQKTENNDKESDIIGDEVNLLSKVVMLEKKINEKDSAIEKLKKVEDIVRWEFLQNVKDSDKWHSKIRNCLLFGIIGIFWFFVAGFCTWTFFHSLLSYLHENPKAQQEYSKLQSPFHFPSIYTCFMVDEKQAGDTVVFDSFSVEINELEKLSKAGIPINAESSTLTFTMQEESISSSSSSDGCTEKCSSNCDVWGCFVYYSGSEAISCYDMCVSDCNDYSEYYESASCMNSTGSSSSGWTCDPNYYSANDGCDCNCGIYDPDCSDEFATIYGCADGQVCNTDGICTWDSGDDDDDDDYGDVPGSWYCSPDFYKDGYVCDCNCGAYDPDCDDETLSVYGCDEGYICSSTGLCTYSGGGESNSTIIPEQWICDNSYYNDTSTCHCGCGILDGDCLDPELPIVGCDEGGYCNNSEGTCEYGPGPPACWTCDPGYYNKSDGCDCNCGCYDPDCDRANQTLYGCDTGDIGCYLNATCISGNVTRRTITSFPIISTTNLKTRDDTRHHHKKRKHQNRSHEEFIRIFNEQKRSFYDKPENQLKRIYSYEQSNPFSSSSSSSGGSSRRADEHQIYPCKVINPLDSIRTTKLGQRLIVRIKYNVTSPFQENAEEYSLEPIIVLFVDHRERAEDLGVPLDRNHLTQIMIEDETMERVEFFSPNSINYCKIKERMSKPYHKDTIKTYEIANTPIIVDYTRMMGGKEQVCDSKVCQGFLNLYFERDQQVISLVEYKEMLWYTPLIAVGGIIGSVGGIKAIIQIFSKKTVIGIQKRIVTKIEKELKKKRQKKKETEFEKEHQKVENEIRKRKENEKKNLLRSLADDFTNVIQRDPKLSTRFSKNEVLSMRKKINDNDDSSNDEELEIELEDFKGLSEQQQQQLKEDILQPLATTTTTTALND